VEATLATTEEKVIEMEGMSMGFCLLAQTLISVHHGIRTGPLRKNIEGSRHSYSIDPDTTIELGEPLGSGSFSHVFKLIDKGREGALIEKFGNAVELVNKKTKGDPKLKPAFIKIPRLYQRRKSLQIEANALAVLNKNSYSYIPELYYTKNPVRYLQIRLKCELSIVPCLPLRGLLGQPANHPDNSWKQINGGLESIISNVYSAIKYAHSQGWVHMDVRPSNIVTSGTQVMLIDWGSAHEINANLTSFVGCRPYAHDELLVR
jgi:serine/threonine protein kinase